MLASLPAPAARQYLGWLLIFVVIKLVLQYLVIHPVYELHRDEFLHLDQANHLAAGYVSVPPLTAWVARLIQLLGNSEFWVRFFPALFGALTMSVVWAAVHELGGGLYAKILAVSAVLLSAILRLNQLFQPNSFDVLAWTSAYYCLLRLVRGGQGRWAVGLGVAVGLGMLNKYNLVFWAAGVVPALLLTPARRLLWQPHTYLAALVALQVFLPNLLWQYQHHWPVLWHMQELQKSQLVHVDRADFLKEQLLFFLNSLVVLGAAAVGLVRYRPLRPYRFVGLAVLFSLLLFVAMQAKGYYAIGLYPILLAIGSVYLEHVLQYGWKRYLRPVMLVLLALLFLPLLWLAFPLKTPEQIRQNPAAYEKIGLLRWEDGKNHALPQDFADMISWREMANLARQGYQQLTPTEQQHLLIITDNYGEAGALNFYNHGRMPAAVSYNADYAYWFPSLENVQVVMLVTEDPLEADDAVHFASSTLVGKVQNPLAREKGTAVYVLRQPDSAIIEEVRQQVQDEQRRMRGLP
ncbi:glycosyltransferase family 39 protein [Hymenobacter cellulosilyticus]|uniref:Glycosyltransferase family 39 protein n=1 Tax=Hymenobacter cellulosilyticus TaxID=2932248 RepID=A0A8T9QAN7_9BACT|nr:glycosyltransferase family 39 protein [Hymenobacter cellulosilyticus]UOQ74072.1 glycosyltransferase family 39 protein [Hymenobacter cellulosilyticus]